MSEPALIARRYEGKSALVTGADGFIGTHLVARLASYGAHVVAFGRHVRDGSRR